MARLLPAQPSPPMPPLGLAVSGGGDSMALTWIAHRWAQARGVALHIATVDHGLRPEAAAEAADVASFAARLGLSHDTLRWRGWDGRGNLQDAARRARRRLLAAWAGERGLAAILIAHTADDQAETFLLRLARGSGVDGLSAMREARQEAGLLWLRPLLGVRREALREVLSRQGIRWAEDPSNTDPRYDRVRMRQALPAFGALGLTVERLADTAARLGEARDALAAQAALAARALLRVEAGDVLADLAGLAAEPVEIRARLLSAALCWVSSAEYRPRRAALDRLSSDLAKGRGGTLHGCLVTERHGVARIGREPRAVLGLRCPAPGIWDSRWRVFGPDCDDLEIGALGPNGLSQRPRWRESGLPRRTLLAQPALWQGQTLIAVPVLDSGSAWRAELREGADVFHSSLIPH
ncbi:tRNA(Ile)-lysidine synthetase [Haematobacter massiliensis]|nr:tRNA lysidine(34) synthetase TilS [Haematobacter massiliensis]OWJ74259.1 tRNA(Ile)-lysidine synthetase [Haematobacter massiliensis]OWJ83973.1 tRNA(Ile)-lysidine synthetase [Haematobacter massiliensis]QBJ25240.1 tRNA lysidine(34) synthetase TilS [Haematobacter massiliensis]